MAPDIFNNVEVAETLTTDPKNILNRKMKIELTKIMPNSDKRYVDVFLKIKNVEGEKAQTELIGHDCSRDYIFRLSRRRTNRLDIVEDVKTKDNVSLRTKIVAITLRKTETSVKKELGAKIREVIHKEAENKNFETIMNDIFLNILQKKILKAVKTTYPLRVLEIRKTEVL